MTELSDENTLDVDFSKLGFQGDISDYVELPYFCFKKKKYKAANYIYDEQRNIRLEVRALEGQYIPTAFDNKVLIVLLKYRFLNKDKEFFYISAYQIAKEIYPNYKVGGESIKRITESINRLRTTTYRVYNGLETTTTILSDLRAVNSLVEVDDLIKEDKLYIIIPSKMLEASLIDKPNICDVLLLIQKISNPTAQRLYGLLKYKSYNPKTGKYRDEMSFAYMDIIPSIPLTALDQRNNKKTVNKLCKELLDSGFIVENKSHYPDGKYFYIKFA